MSEEVEKPVKVKKSIIERIAENFIEKFSKEIVEKLLKMFYRIKAISFRKLIVLS